MHVQCRSATNLAVISDIHGNLPALEAVLSEIALLPVDLIVCGGDVAAGPMPRETIERLHGLDLPAVFIRGNADRELVERFDLARSGGALGAAQDEAADRVLDWTTAQLTRAHRDFLAGFADLVAVDLPGIGETLFCHGSPRSDEEIVTAITPAARLGPMFDGVSHRVVVCCHTHVQFDRTAGDRRLVNPGSIGMPYEGRPGAFWAYLSGSVDLRRTAYDVEAATRRIRATGYPDADGFAEGNVLHPPSSHDVSTFFEQVAAERDAQTG